MFALIMSKGGMIYHVNCMLPPKHSIHLVGITLQLSKVLSLFMKTDIITWSLRKSDS